MRNIKFINIVFGAFLSFSVLSFSACAKETNKHIDNNMNLNNINNEHNVREPVVTFRTDEQGNKSFISCCYDSTNDTCDFTRSNQENGQILLNLSVKINPNDVKKSLINKNSNEQLICTIARDKSAGLPEILHQMPLTVNKTNESTILSCSFTVTPAQHDLLKNIASANEDNEDLVIDIHKSGTNFSDVNSFFENLVGHFEIKPNAAILN